MRKTLVTVIIVLLFATCQQVWAIYGTKNAQEFKKAEQNKFAILECGRIDMSGNPCASSKSSRACLCRK